MRTKHVLVASPRAGFRSLLPSSGRLVFGLAGALALAGGTAQAQLPSYANGNFIQSPPGLTGLYHGIVAGDLNGDLSLDVAVIKGSTLIVYPSADVSFGSVVVASDAIDVCFSPDASGPGAPGLLFTTPSGLKRLTVQPGAPDIYSVQLLSSAALWCNAMLIRSSVGVGSGPGQGLIGVHSNEHTFFTASPAGTSFAAPATIFELPPYARDVVLLDWNGLPDNKREIGILHSNGIQIRDAFGNVLLARSAVNPGDAIAVVAKSGLTDSLAWVTRLSSGNSNLLVFNQGFPGLYQPPQDLGARVYGSMASEDLLGDGDGDLVFGGALWSTLQIRENDSSAATWFSPQTTEEVDLRIDGGAGPPMVPVGKVLCANLFNDWTDDTPLPGFAAVLTEQDGLRLVPHLSARHPSTAADFDLGTVHWPCGDHGRWELELGPGWGSTTANFLQLIVWVATEPGVASIQDTALRHILFSLEGTPVDAAMVSFDLDHGQDVEVEDDVYFAQVRPIRIVTVSGQPPSLANMNRAWRWSIAGLPMNDAGMNWLENQPGNGGPVSSSEVNCVPPPAALGGRYIPTPVILSHIPGGPGSAPSIPPPTIQ